MISTSLTENVTKRYMLTSLTKPAGPDLYILFCCCNWNWKKKDIKNTEIKQDPPACDSFTMSLWTINPELYHIKGNLVDEKHPLLRCWRVCNRHNRCPRRSPRSCFSDSSPSSTAAPTSCAPPPSPGWPSCPGSWAQRGRSCFGATSTRSSCVSDSISANAALSFATQSMVEGQHIGKKRWLMSQGVASDLNRNKATCVFLSYWKSKSWPQIYKIYKLWVIRIPVLETLCLWVWAFWGWLRRRVLSPLSVLPGQNFVLLFSFYETRSYRMNVALRC